jgi:hypothetical protein
VANALAGALAEMDYALAPLLGDMAVGDHDVGGFDEIPIRVAVALLDHAAVMGSASAGPDPGD